MTLKEWMAANEVDDDWLAKQLSYSHGGAKKLRLGYREPRIAIMDRIERITRGEVTRYDWPITAV